MEMPTELLNALGALPADFHGAGCLPLENLEALARHTLAREVRRSVETGTGKSTLLLSHLSHRHTVFALDGGHSLSITRSNHLLRGDHVEFVEGPTQLTLMQHAFTEPLQLALIDGPHGFPFPQMEYWKIYPHLEVGGLLVVDDIHIPTIRQLFDVIAEDDMFRLLEIVGNTAFFDRTAAPTFAPTGDGWWLQAYNARRFPISPEQTPTVTSASDSVIYRERLLPLIAQWNAFHTRVAIFGIGSHTDRMFELVPELASLRIVAYLDTSDAASGTAYRGVSVRHPSWTRGEADVILCSSFAYELAQLKIVDHIPVKAVLSHPPSHRMMSDMVVQRAKLPAAA